MESKSRKKIIAVIGGRNVSHEAEAYAYETGKMIADLGAVLICGGHSGAMEFAAKGCFENNGITLGVLPESESSSANPYIQIPIATGIGIARNSIIAHSADILIAIEGSYGTLSEIAFALQLSKKVYSYHSWPLNQFEKNVFFEEIYSIEDLKTKIIEMV